MSFFLADTRKAMGFDAVLSLLAPLSPYGRRYKKDLQPFLPGEEEQLQEEFLAVEKTAAALQKVDPVLWRRLLSLYAALPEIGETVLLLKSGFTLNEIQLFTMKKFLYLIHRLSLLLQEAVLIRETCLKFSPPDELTEKLIGNQDNYHFDLGDYGGPEYQSLQNKIKKLTHQLSEAALQSEEGQSEKKPSPYELVLEASLGETQREAEEEEERIKKCLSEMLKKYTGYFEEAQAAIGYSDFLLAKAEFFNRYRCSLPRITRRMEIKLDQGISLQIQKDLERNNKPFVPVSIETSSPTIVITGANMGGKTVTLKTIGLLAAMAQHGIPVSAENFQLPLFHFLFCAGERQEKTGLSSFAGEIQILQEILNRIEAKGLVLLDEPARSTNPVEGLSIVGAFLKRMASGQSICFVVTHFEGLAGMTEGEHWQVRGVKSIKKLACQGDLERLFDYRLERVGAEIPVPQDAIKVAELLGLDQEVIDQARIIFQKMAKEARDADIKNRPEES